MKAVFAMLAFVLVLGAATAGTVTLSGTCSSSLVNSTSNSVYLRLSNSGNESATNLLVIPKFGGASTYNATGSAPYISPGQNETFIFHFHNFTTPGSYIGAFTVQYSQDQSTFFAIFPCEVNFVNATHSLASIVNVSQVGNVLHVWVINIGTEQITANVSMLLPPQFQSSPQQVSVIMPPDSTAAANFTLSYPKMPGAAYTSAVALSYLQDGLHYSTADTYVISTSPSHAPLSQYSIYLIMVAVLMVIVALIAVSIAKNRQRKGKSEAPSGLSGA
ncbi:MAG TPA: hypothetical protein VL944_01605 [Candidatus Acidoferrum sp.]|nr:hypothetical protein [Candidatus Acidoferrum sp.]